MRRPPSGIEITVNREISRPIIVGGKVKVGDIVTLTGFGFDDDAEFEVMGQRHLLTHGDQTRGGGGIGGIWPPLMRLHARKQQRQSALGRPFAHLWLGHWHQATFGPSFTVNGSLVGYSAFSAECNFPVEPPQQVVAFVDRDRIAWRTTIVV